MRPELLACAVVAWAACSGAPAIPAPAGSRAQYAALEARTVRIVTACADGPGWGSGVVLRAGLVATAAHVTQPACRMTIRGNPAVVLAIDEAADIAILRATSPYVWQPLSLGPAVYRGQLVTVVGYPMRSKTGRAELSVSPGYVTTTYSDRIQVSAPGYFGGSGGPAFNDAGELVGLFVAIDALQGFGMAAVPIDGGYYLTPAGRVFELAAGL